MSGNKAFRPDNKQTNALVKAGKAASIDARKDSKAQGIAVVYVDGNTIYREHPDGKTERIGNIADNSNESSLTKGTVVRRAR